MQDKCPNCGETLITKTIKKELGLGSIDYPVAQACPKCGWSRDLTGAGEISKPVEIPKKELAPVIKAHPPKTIPKPEPSAGINKLITVALAIIVLAGLIWAFFIYPTQPEKTKGGITPTPTSEITRTPVQTTTPAPEVTPTGNKTRIKLDSARGFIPSSQKIKVGDEVVWRNDEKITVTLVSSEGLFEEQILAYDKEHRYIFSKPGTYIFSLKEKNLSGTIIVEY